MGLSRAPVVTQAHQWRRARGETLGSLALLCQQTDNLATRPTPRLRTQPSVPSCAHTGMQANANTETDASLHTVWPSSDHLAIPTWWKLAPAHLLHRKMVLLFNLREGGLQVSSFVAAEPHPACVNDVLRADEELACATSSPKVLDTAWEGCGCVYHDIAPACSSPSSGIGAADLFGVSRVPLEALVECRASLVDLVVDARTESSAGPRVQVALATSC